MCLQDRKSEAPQAEAPATQLSHWLKLPGPGESASILTVQQGTQAVDAMLKDLLNCVSEYVSDYGFNGPITHYSWDMEGAREVVYRHLRVEAEAPRGDQPNVEKFISSTWDYAAKHKKGERWVIAEFERALRSEWKR